MKIVNLFNEAAQRTKDARARGVYEILNTGGYKSGSWRTEDKGEDMSVISQVIMQYWKPRFLLDHRTRCAYEFMDSREKLCTVGHEDIDWESLQDLPADSISQARALDFHYPSFIRMFENGVAEVSWQLNPDGMYFMDEDGFGMTDDDEVEIYGFIDRKGKVVVKFQDIHNDWDRLKAMRKEAESIINK